MSANKLASGPLMQHAHGARARELGRLGRLLRPRAGTIWRDLVRGGPFSTQLSSPARECSPRRPHPFPTGPSSAHHGARIPSPQDPRGTRPPFARNRLHHDPIAGELLLFPPWLVHGVTPSCELAPVRVVDCH
jgi:hypothetical protein